ncbi:5-oxoprolinase subunit PxpB [Micropruina sonneratiae]|uniref:5-oxoprolinase subunit PxpB n=1 Tax=Micropruina sonneratiae TaxID=2986940 RepID=UPI0022280B22|nr:5-oxoprolinase subunit PxpB [Micropruina sp. KQZ13P-5]MCW3159043.1 5-oxoprolinase subunit PxpB [Micropruina sp. KQZ13P-5]
MEGRLLPCGEAAVLVELDSLDAVLTLQSALAEASDEPGWSAVIDVVPAATTVLVGVDDPAALTALRERLTQLLTRLDVALVGETGGELVEIDVVYDGEDLDEVARLTGLSAREVIEAHTGSDWTVAFGGFAPGFSYLVGGDPRLEVPRRAEPRTSVPAGSVGLAGSFSGIYPRSSPGGWQLIGRTDAVLFDVDRDPPALLRPGRRVRFRAVDAGVAEGVACKGDGSITGQTPTTAVAQKGTVPISGREALTVTATGPLVIVVDAGRPGLASTGVSRSGAADRGAYALANRLVGNPAGTPALEVVFGGLGVRADSTCLVAVTGADCAPLIDGRPATHNGPVYLREGQELTLSTPAAGLRSYVAVAGGLDVGATLGSASTDTLSGLGPAKLRPGDRIGLHSPRAPRFADVDLVPAGPLAGAVLTLDVLPGPRTGWLADPDALTRTTWKVAAQSDRVGVRLEGDPLARHADVAERELPSEPMVRGSIQVPPDGRPVIFGADHPVTGGYPVVGVLTEAASDALAQARPGQQIVLRPAGR